MAHNFHFPPSNYRKTHDDEHYSPLNVFSELPCNANFSRTVIANDSHVPTASSHSYPRAFGHPGPHQTTEAILKTEPHFGMLMAAHNHAYTDLFDKYMHEKYQLEAQVNLVTELKDELKEARNLTKITSSSHYRNADSAEDLAPKLLSIKIPECPAVEKQEDYPDVRFWCKTDWIEFESRARNRNEQTHKLYFLCDESGLTISKARRDEMTETAKIAFNQLYYWRIDPPTWSKRIEHAFQYISATMRTRFPEFRWCQGDWKVQEFVKIRYPDWTRHYRDPGTLTRAKPSVGKHRTDESNTGDRKPKKRRLNKPPASGKEVIKIESDEPPSRHPSTPAEDTSSNSSPSQLRLAPSPSSHVLASSLTRSGASTPTRPFFASSAATNEPETAAAISHPEPLQNPVLTTPLSSITASEASSTTTNPSLNVNPTATAMPPSAPPAPLSHIVVNAISETPQPQTALIIGLISTIGTPPTQSSEIAVNGEAAQGATVTRRSRFNPFKVPKPSFEVPAPPVTTSSVPALGLPKPKMGKVMVPSKTSLTARNLYALDYEKDHREDPVTAAEFKKIYDNLDAKTLKRYKALSKAKKAAVKALPMPNDS